MGLGSFSDRTKMMMCGLPRAALTPQKVTVRWRGPTAPSLNPPSPSPAPPSIHHHPFRNRYYLVVGCRLLVVGGRADFQGHPFGGEGGMGRRRRRRRSSLATGKPKSCPGINPGRAKFDVEPSSSSHCPLGRRPSASARKSQPLLGLPGSGDDAVRRHRGVFLG